ncbi:hypothetical protein PUN28_007497 [Cardiocondyla obscurior]|uniref:Uncharacterized protein n=1 Tax=Cardiocondyla obscurior TaxID=286306 RepID=A0AAW2G8K5_9HYME
MPPAPGTDDVTVAAQESSTSSRPATSPPPRRDCPPFARRSSSTRSSCTLHKARFSSRIAVTPVKVSSSSVRSGPVAGFYVFRYRPGMRFVSASE